MGVQQKISLISGGLLIVLGGLLLAQSMMSVSGWVWAEVIGLSSLAVLVVYLKDRMQNAAIAFYVLAGMGLPFLYVYLRNRQYWWALIPFYTILTVG
jgi:hypothetical protein